MLRTFTLSIILFSAAGAQAATTLDAAMGLRLNGRPDLAQSLLLEQVEKNPSDAQALFELGVAEASLGKCSTAAKTFAAAKELVDEASLSTAVRAAMDDLCPKLDRWSISTGFNIHAGPNINGGSETREVEIGGLPYTLSDEAMAQSGFGITASASVSYNAPMGERTYLVPQLGLSVTEATGDSIDGEKLSLGLDLMSLTDIGSLAFGPRYTRNRDADGLASTEAGVGGRIVTRKGNAERSWDANLMQVDYQSDRLDGTTASLSVSQAWNFAEHGTSLTLAGFGSHADRADDTEDLSSLGVSVSASAPLNEKFSVRLEGSLSGSTGHQRNPVFGVTRRDMLVRVAATIKYHGFKTRFGEPYAGVEHVTSSSNFEMKSFTHRSLVAGFSESF